jgi:serine protease inhibitor
LKGFSNKEKTPEDEVKSWLEERGLGKIQEVVMARKIGNMI